MYTTSRLQNSFTFACKAGYAATFGHMANYPRLRLASWLGLPVVAALSFVAFGTGSPPVIPAVNLSADPLYASAGGDKPLLALALSVEFPTVGAQYVQTPSATLDSAYSNTNEYLGYYDAESCYKYNDSPAETPASPQTNTDYRRFDRLGAATSRMCNVSYPTGFSGNFLNWASSSAIDMLRLSLTGGDRYIDTPSLTILQRAVIPANDPICMWNSANFPAKQLSRAGGSSGAAYFGAVPLTMGTAAGTDDIWIGNMLQRIYFRSGAASAGSCNDQSGYTLGTATANWRGTITSYSAKPTGWPTTPVYVRGDTITLTGVREVLYGRGSNWKSAPASGVVTCKETTFTGGPTNNSSECFVRDNASGETQAGVLTSDPFFYARVQACNTVSGVLQDVRDYGLCKQYPSGNFKPSGAVQKYSDQLRLAAFGYLMDQTASYNSGGRYGGVLRVPVKYVGSKTFDENGVENTPTGGNANKEWDVNTGVFNVNPDGDTIYGKSGIITYLNQFGRTGPVPGRYKKYDPVGELHYETLRYLQGLQPSADSISGITADMYDGFPVTTSWTDPYGGTRSPTSDYSCLKSNIVVIGDVNTHDGGRLPSASAANNIPDINYWRGIVQSYEKDLGTTYTDGQGASRTTGNPNGSNNSVPSSTDRSQILGSAYWAHTQDIRGTAWSDTAKRRPGLRVKTFTFDVNEYAQQNSAAVRRTSNQFFMASKYGGFETNAANIVSSTNPLSFNTQGNPFKRDNGTVDKYVWEDTDTRASRVGEANTYFLQSDARGVLSAFDDIFSRSGRGARSIAGGAIQSKSLTQAGDTIYQGAFEVADWSGDLFAIPVNVSTTNTVSIGATNTWTAATRLNAMTTPVTSRKIFMGNDGATKNPIAAPFLWSTTGVDGTDGIEAAVKTELNKPAPAAAADAKGEDRLNYLRGDKSKEIANLPTSPAPVAPFPFRTRNSLLGDIVNSGVAYSGVPTTSINDSGYQAFYAANAARTTAVFVGANDGMLHAFNALTGDELFAYIPSWLRSKLSALTVPSYLNNHQSYVDGTPVVGEALVGTNWKTVLVSGTGAGGQGVFALDVTNPATSGTNAFDQSKVMWEFTHADDPDMGNVTGRPQILKMRTSAYGAPTTTYKWFAVVGGGLNSYVGSTGYGSGYPALFVLDLSKPVGTAWQLGTNYYKISLPVGGDLSLLTTGGLTASTATGLINFKAALGSAREVTHMFMGDLHGQLWKLDFSLVGSADWNIIKLSPFKTGTSPNFVPYPLFIATDSGGLRQPITMSPSIAFGPVQDSSYIVFGTGKYLEASDKTTNTQQSAYMVYDNGTATPDTLIGTRISAISGRVRLKPGTANGTTGVVSVPAFTLGRAATANEATEAVRSGWYFDYPMSGERQISNATLLGATAIFGSLIPSVTAAASSCSAADGGGNVYTVNIASGNGTGIRSTVGILGEPLVAEITGATTLTATDSTGRRVKTTTSQVLQQGSIGIGVGTTVTTTSIAGRLSWRQINNYQDLK